MGVVYEDDRVTLDDFVTQRIDDNILRRVRRGAEHLADLALKSSWKF
jgi:hypothetical protein